jgi:hypothetical protein
VIHSAQALLRAVCFRRKEALGRSRSRAHRPQLRHFHHTAFTIGTVHAVLGDYVKAQEWLERTAAEFFPTLFESDPLLARLREQPDSGLSGALRRGEHVEGEGTGWRNIGTFSQARPDNSRRPILTRFTTAMELASIRRDPQRRFNRVPPGIGRGVMAAAAPLLVASAVGRLSAGNPFAKYNGANSGTTLTGEDARAREEGKDATPIASISALRRQGPAEDLAEESIRAHEKDEEADANRSSEEDRCPTAESIEESGRSSPRRTGHRISVFAAQRSVVDGVRRRVRRGHRGADRHTQLVTASRPSERPRRGQPRATGRCGPGVSRDVEACVKGSPYDQGCADSESQRTATTSRAAVPTTKPAIEPAASMNPTPNTAAQNATPVTIQGCLQAGNEGFWLKDVSGADAPTSRSWKSGFLKKRSASVEVVDAPDSLRLANYLGQRVSATGSLTDRRLQVRSLNRVAGSCN